VFAFTFYASQSVYIWHSRDLVSVQFYWLLGIGGRRREREKRHTPAVFLHTHPSARKQSAAQFISVRSLFCLPGALAAQGDGERCFLSTARAFPSIRGHSEYFRHSATHASFSSLSKVNLNQPEESGWMK
jgi:hypothetical protein